MTPGVRVRLTVAAMILPVLLGAGALPAQDREPAESPGASAGERVPEGTETAFALTDPRIAESSGMAASVRHEGVYWTHNDSGPQYGPDVYAVDERGETVATVRLAGDGVEARDWEAVAVGADDAGEPAVYVADIGDNYQGGWPDVRVYRLPEPRDLVDQTVTATAFTLAYADGGRDAEGILVDPRDNRLYVVSKELAGGLYAAPERLDPEAVNTLTRVGPAPLFATDASFSPDGGYYAIRTYWSVAVYDASEGVPGRSTARLGLPESDQGESLAYTRDGTALLAGTEGVGSPVWRVPLPETEPAPAAPSEEESRPSGGGEASGPREDGGAGLLILGGVGVALVVVLAITWLARSG
ncbi:hypothetical protein EV190_101461 [Actinorugispora endophytica]|uniref:WD40 repeat protein n=2 Tax=Actinorugispora endophytica TaxID=1605990 RepID=A0A4R6V8P8_9ACTN|nr:hypothetical protein [Actinorugispora endophytica]TDQ55138.1 hypothetical protein EV190_101461 [Actinorugispora endophytica]